MQHEAKAKRGRKPFVEGQRMFQRMVTIDEETAETLRQLGDGNLSEGVRRAATLVCRNITMIESAGRQKAGADEQ